MAAEARETYAEVQVSDDPGDVIRVHIPTAEALQELQGLQRTADFAGAVAVLIGKDNADRLREAQPDAPFTAYRDLIFGVMEDLGLGGPGAPPESSAVPSS